MPNNFVFISVYFILPKCERKPVPFPQFIDVTVEVFLNSLLATLNAREKLRGQAAISENVVSIPLTTNINSIGGGLSSSGKTDTSYETSQPVIVSFHRLR